MRKFLVGAAGALALTVGFTTAEARDLRVGVAAHVKTLDTAADVSNAGAQMTYSVHDTLILRDVTSARPVFKPGLATAWKQVEPTVWDITLRPGVMMHDGHEMDAEDVAFSLNRIIKRENPRFGTAWGRFFYNFEAVTVTGPLSVQIKTKRPEPLFETLLSDMAASILSKRKFDAVGFDRFQIETAGAGPYKIATFQPGKLLVVEKFDKYWGEKAPLDKITFTEIPELATRVTALVNNEMDFITQVPPQQEAPLARHDKVSLVNVTWPMFHVYALNMSLGHTANPKIREAMVLAIDREALNKALWKGRGIVPKAHQFADYGAPLYMPDLELIKFDPARAKQLVKESGYDGSPILFTFLPTYYTYGDLAAQAVKEMWEAVGLKVELQSLDDIKDNSKVLIRPWSNPMYYPDPMGAFDTHWSSASWVSREKLFVPSSPEWAATYEAARFATDLAARRDAYRKLLTLAEADHPYILLYQPNENFALRKGISWKIPVGMRPYTLSFRAGQIDFSTP